MSILKRIGLVVAIVVSCIGCDHTTKSVAKEYLAPAEGLSFLGDTIRLQLAHNYGAFLSLGDSLPETWRPWIVSFGSIAGLVGLLIYLGLRISRGTSTVVGLSLLVGGGLSNLMDRAWNGGYVVDFINIGIGPIRTGIFNVADMALCLGLLLLLVGERVNGNRSGDAPGG